MISPPPIPVPIVSMTAFRAPRAAPKRCSARIATLASLSIEHRQPEPLRHQVPDRHVGELEVDGDDRHAPLGGRSCTGCPSPAAATSGRASLRGPQLALERLEQLVLAQAMAGRRGAVDDPALGVHDPDQHLRPAQVDADGLDSAQPKSPAASWARRPAREGSGPCGSITRSCLPTASRGEQGRPEPPDYKVYRSRPGLLSRLRSPDLVQAPRARQRQGRQGRRARPARPGRRSQGAPPARPPWRRVLKWVGIAALAWIVLSFLAFAISSQIQKWKLVDMGNTLHGNPFLAVSPQTILVLGTDIRSGQFAGPDEAASKSCLEAAGSGKAPPSHCTPYRSDTIMLVRAGGGAFRKLSIPRDTLAEIPGQPENKINSAYAFGGAKLTVRTVEKFLGINVDQVAIIDFDGFRKFIDTIGGVKVDIAHEGLLERLGRGLQPEAVSKGEHTLNGFQAITLARTRENNLSAPRAADLTGHHDIDRAQFQQLILDGIRGRLTDPLRLPYNFIKGPFIGWNAPKAMVSSMGAWTMPQLVFAAVIGFSNGTDVLKPAGDHRRRQPDHPPGRVRAGGEEVPRRRPAAQRRPAPRRASRDGVRRRVGEKWRYRHFLDQPTSLVVLLRRGGGRFLVRLGVLRALGVLRVLRVLGVRVAVARTPWRCPCARSRWCRSPSP